MARHGVSVAQASEALNDPDAVVFDPDYASQSGSKYPHDRVVCWYGRILSVITVVEDGVVYGVNGWTANSTDVAFYKGADNNE